MQRPSQPRRPGLFSRFLAFFKRWVKPALVTFADPLGGGRQNHAGQSARQTRGGKDRQGPFCRLQAEPLENRIYPGETLLTALWVAPTTPFLRSAAETPPVVNTASWSSAAAVQDGEWREGGPTLTPLPTTSPASSATRTGTGTPPFSAFSVTGPPAGFPGWQTFGVSLLGGDPFPDPLESSSVTFARGAQVF